MTDVEAILQILRSQPDTHILVCTPSNSAADLLAQRLSALHCSAPPSSCVAMRSSATG